MAITPPSTRHLRVERAAGRTNLIEVLDRVLDKGIVIDAWVRASVMGIDLITVDAHVVVASIDTYLSSWPQLIPTLEGDSFLS